MRSTITIAMLFVACVLPASAHADQFKRGRDGLCQWHSAPYKIGTPPPQVTRLELAQCHAQPKGAPINLALFLKKTR